MRPENPEHELSIGADSAASAAWKLGDHVFVDADPRGFGPYVAGAALLRQIVEANPAAARALGQPHVLTVLAVAPNLKPKLCVSDAVEASLAVSREGNARSWTMRLAHGLSDIVLDHVSGAVSFLNVDAADPLDQEFIAVLLRRADPRRVRVRVIARAERFETALADALRAHARAAPTPQQSAPSPPASDHTDLSADALLALATDCMRLAYYDAALDYAHRGLNALGPADRGKTHSELTRHTIFASLLLGRYDDVERICNDPRPGDSDPALMAHATYAMAILNARLYDPARHDYEAARAWIEQSLAFTEALPASEVRTVNIAFLHNTMALVQMRKGRRQAALRLLNRAIRLMAREAPSKFRIESAILLHNRARLRLAMRQPDAAIADLTHLLRQQPSDADAYLDRGLIHQRSGRFAGALADYDAAIAWSPPFEEAHFNRAQTLAALGRPDEALRDYDRVLILNPHHVEARINRACLFYDLGDHDAAGTDVNAALERSADNARALCLHGLLQQAAGASSEAYRSFTAAIASDPRLADAWANRAVIAFGRGDSEAALEDLSAALALREDPAILCNRARVFERASRWSEAEADYARALALAPGLAGVEARLQNCRSR